MAYDFTGVTCNFFMESGPTYAKVALGSREPQKSEQNGHLT